MPQRRCTFLAIRLVAPSFFFTLPVKGIMIGASSAIQDVKASIQNCVDAARGRKISVQQDPQLFSKLVVSLLSLLRFGLQPGSSFLRFFQAASKEIPPTPEIHDVLTKVMESSDPTVSAMPLVERETVFLIVSLQAPGSLMRTTQRLFRLSNVMHGYYFPDAPFFSESFVAQELQPVLLKLARLPLLPPSIEDGLRALHFFRLDEDARQPGATGNAFSSPPQVESAVSSAPTTSRSIDTVTQQVDQQGPLTPLNLASATAASVLLDDVSAQGSFSPLARPQPTPVLLKKKKRSKQAVDMSTQTAEITDAAPLVRSVAVTATPSCAHAGVQTTSNASTFSSPPRSQNSQQRRSVSPSASWESALAAREVALLARTHELDERERSLREREQLILGLESASSPPRHTAGTHWQQLCVRNSASPRTNNGRCLSNAIRGEFEVASPQASLPRNRRGVDGDAESSPKPRPVGGASPRQIIAASVEQPSLEGTRAGATATTATPFTPPDNLSTVFLWSLHSSTAMGVNIAQEQGHVCAQCGLPVSKEEVSHDANVEATVGSVNTARASSSGPQRLQSLAALKSGPGSVVSKVVASATQWRQQLESKLGSQSARVSNSDDTVDRLDLTSTPTTPPDQPASVSRSAVDASGFRVCHYTGSVFCRNCLPDGCTYIIPAKVVANWDFNLYPVCSDAQLVLRKNTSTPTIHAAALATVARARSLGVFEAARGLRRQLRILHSIMGSCPDVRATEALSSVVYSRYAAINEVYTLRDLVELRGFVLSSNDVDTDGSALTVVQHTQTILRPLPNDDPTALLGRLKKMRDLAVLHCVRECDRCKANAAKPCGLCSDTKPLFLFDLQNVEVCGDCREVYHRSCWDLTERKCSRCAASRH